MKVLYLLLGVMFVIFAFVQVNDPDPALWIVAYGLVAVFCVLAAYRTFFRVPLFILVVAYASYAFTFFAGVQTWLAQEDRSGLFDDVAKMQYPYIEEAREFLGLMICAIVLMLQLVHSLVTKKMR